MGLENNNFDNWSNTTLGVVMAKKGYIRGPFGSALKRGEMLNEGVPVYEQANAIYNHRKFRYFIGDEKHATLLRFTVKPNDILISCSGTFGRTTIIEDGDPLGIISQALLILRSDPNKINVKYLNYYLNSREGKIKLSGMSHGSVQVNIAKRADVESIELYLPPLPEQKAIAKVLTAFDDKIELLQAQNKTLETMAQTIFKEWFGKYQIGDDLPEGWRVGELGDILEIKYGKDHKHLKDGIYPLYGSGGIMRYVEKPLYSKKSILIPRKGTLTNLFFLNEPFWSVDTMFYGIIKHSFQGRFSYLFLQSIDLSSMNVGSAVPSLTTRVLNQIPIVIPKNEYLIKFDDLVAPVYDKIEFNYSQIQSLSKTRDTLLPKLMSGQLRVNNIKQTANA